MLPISSSVRTKENLKECTAYIFAEEYSKPQGDNGTAMRMANPTITEDFHFKI
jgi:hypothetical protein